jgi:hypothetical protein
VGELDDEIEQEMPDGYQVNLSNIMVHRVFSSFQKRLLFSKYIVDNIATQV